MAVKEVIEIEAKTGEAQSEIDKLRKDFEKLTNATEKNAKAQEKTALSVGKLSKGLGTLVKGAAIGLALKLFNSFMEILQSNQRVADAFAIGLESLSIVFNDLVNFLLDNTGPVIDFFKEIFENPVESIKSLGEAIKDNVIERFNSLLDTIGFVGDAIKKFVTGDWDGAKEAAINAGKELVDVYTGVDGTVDKVSKAVTEGAEALANYSQEVVKTAKNNVELEKTAATAAARNAGLIEQYDRQAELLRQTRDEERNTLDDRIKANDELAKVLDEQEKAMLANANAILASAQAQFNKNQNQENEIALIEAQNELLGVQAQIEGFRSEQKTNDLALSRELAQVDRDRAEAAIDNLETTRRAEIEAMDSEKARMEATISLEEELFNKRIQLIAARLEAEKEGSVTYAEILNERSQIEAEFAATNKTATSDLTKFNIDLKRQEEDAKLNIVGNALSAAAGLAEQGSATYKALAVAQVLLDTFRGVQAAFASNAANVGATTLTGGSWPFIQAAAAAAFGAANLAGILAVDPKSPSPSAPSLPSSTGPSVASASAAPRFNTVAAIEQNRLLNDISGNTNRPARAYVVASDVSSAQELDRKRIKNATF